MKFAIVALLATGSQAVTIRQMIASAPLAAADDPTNAAYAGGAGTLPAVNDPTDAACDPMALPPMPPAAGYDTANPANVGPAAGG